MFSPSASLKLKAVRARIESLLKVTGEVESLSAAGPMNDATLSPMEKLEPRDISTKLLSLAEKKTLWADDFQIIHKL